MAEFKSYRSYWDFERSVKFQNRYVYGPETEEFLNTVSVTAKKREKPLPKGAILWRAQLGNSTRPVIHEGEHIDDAPAPFPQERMKPIHGEALEGRANPKGIAYLYLSRERKTSKSEVRPWIDSYVSVGQFKILKNLTIIDCTINPKGFTFYMEEPDPEEREKAVWSNIDRAFAKPVNQNEKAVDYVPTQILAELFKNSGYDGIAYKSYLGKSFNIVLFDLNVADIINCFLYQAEKVSFDFRKDTNPYFVKKHYSKDSNE